MRKRLVATAVLASSLAHADAPQTARADGHAPIGVMADHLHKAGDWMVGYRFMRTWQKDALPESVAISRCFRESSENCGSPAVPGDHRAAKLRSHTLFGRGR